MAELMAPISSFQIAAPALPTVIGLASELPPAETDMLFHRAASFMLFLMVA
jgi:hypothetical protein